MTQRSKTMTQRSKNTTQTNLQILLHLLLSLREPLLEDIEGSFVGKVTLRLSLRGQAPCSRSWSIFSCILTESEICVLSEISKLQPEF